MYIIYSWEIIFVHNEELIKQKFPAKIIHQQTNKKN